MRYPIIETAIKSANTFFIGQEGSRYMFSEYAFGEL